MKKFFKKLFCKHKYVYEKSTSETFREEDFSGDGTNILTVRYDYYRCTKCGKTKRKFLGYF